MAYPSLYRAKVAQTNGTSATVYVPQVFGETPVVVRDSIGALPSAPGMGWVFFQAGNPEFPVWVGVQSGGGGTGGDDEMFIGPEDPGPTYELWYDTDASAQTTPTVTTVSYVHVQGAASSLWTITHGLGWYPNATVIDSAGSTVEGDITQLNTNTMTIAFNGSFTGKAYLS
jgi:hypothetical protein